MAEYTVRDGYTGLFGAKTAKEFARIIVDLEEELGRPVTPQDLVVEAYPADSPLHAFFEWDDTRAANFYRIVQARKILRAIEVVLPETGGRKVRAFVPTTREGGEGFLSTERVVKDRPDIVEMMFRRAYDEAVRVDEMLGTWRDVLQNVEAKRFADAARDLRESYQRNQAQKRTGAPA